MWGDIAIAFLLAFIIAFMTTPYMIKIAKKVGAVECTKKKCLNLEVLLLY